MTLVLVLSGPLRVEAEPSPIELEAARKLFDDGVRQEEAGDWAGALATFRKVAAVRSSPAVHFHLGLCLEKTGKWVEARSEFLAAERDANDKADSKATAERARSHADALRGRIPAVVLVPPATAATITVTIDGQPVSSALIGAQIPLDPGAHRIEARAPGYRTLTRDIELEERAVERVQLTMIPEGSAVVPEKPTPVESGGTRFGALPWIVSGVAVVSLGGAGVFYGLRAREASNLEGACPSSKCADDERDSYDRGRAFNTAGNVLLVASAVAGATAITLFVFNSAPRASVAASARGVSFSLAF